MSVRLAIVAACALAGCTPPVLTGKIVAITPVDAPPAPSRLPPEPTLRLPRDFTPSGYQVSLAIDPAKPGFTGRIEIAGTIGARTSRIWLHARQLAITGATASSGDPGHDVTLTATPHGEDLLELDAAGALEPGRWTLTLAYRGTYDLLETAGAFKQVVGKDAYVYSQLEAIYARRVFPCIDEPDVKVPWQLALDVPKELVAVTNTPIVSSEPIGDDGRYKRVVFAPTRPLPSYLVAFGVGPFEVVDAGTTKGGTPIHILALRGRRADATWAAKTAPRILELVEDYFGMPYPYPKLDFLAIPLTVGFSAMENAGLITVSETSMLLDGKASKSRLYAWVFVSAHEVAHQWFGDLVTMRWWDDIWLNEGFADWMEHRISARFDPSWHDAMSDVARHQRALDADALVSARRVRQPIASPDDILTAFDAITYAKGSSVLDMFEAFVGPDRFRDGVRAYVAATADGNATSSDFVSAISKVAGQDLAPAFATFLDQAGAPEITATVDCTTANAVVTLTQRRFLPLGAAKPQATRPWILPVCLGYALDAHRVQRCVPVSEPTTTVELTGCPAWLVTNAGGRGYYHSAYTAAQLTALRDIGWDQLDWSERMSIAYEARTYAIAATLPLALAGSFVPKLLAGDDRFTIAAAIALARRLDDDVPDDLRAKYEQWIRVMFGPGAETVGLLPRPTDELDAELTRGELLRTVGRIGRDPKIIDEAVHLAARWATLPQGVRPILLELAVDAKPELFAQILADVYKEPDRTRRGEMFAALARVRDPGRQVTALALVLDARLDLRETVGLLLDVRTETARRVAQRFFRDHEAEILKRLPTDGTAGSVADDLVTLFTDSCDVARRDEVAAYVERTFGRPAGGDHVVREAIEEMDQCIATRKVLAPELRGWLNGMKLIKTTRPRRP